MINKLFPRKFIRGSESPSLVIHHCSETDTLMPRAPSSTIKISNRLSNEDLVGLLKLRNDVDVLIKGLSCDKVTLFLKEAVIQGYEVKHG